MQSVELDRLCFLLWDDMNDEFDVEGGTPDAARVVELGWRLLGKCPDDVEVEEDQAMQLWKLPRPDAVAAALRCASDALRRRPHESRAVGVLAQVHLGAFFRYHTPADAREFIRLWRRYLKLKWPSAQDEAWLIKDVQGLISQRKK